MKYLECMKGPWGLKKWSRLDLFQGYVEVPVETDEAHVAVALANAAEARGELKPDMCPVFVHVMDAHGEVVSGYTVHWMRGVGFVAVKSF